MAAVAATLAIVSCSKEDDGSFNPNASVPDPAGTVTFNMMNYDNGRSYLADTDIYIDRGDNFSGGGFVDLGAMKGVGNIPATPVFEGLNNSCAVIPGHGYWIYSWRWGAANVFPSGKTALLVGGTHYRLYVDSWIASTINSIMGAVVKYVPYKVENKHGLPENNAEIGEVTEVGDTVDITLPGTAKDIEISQQGWNTTCDVSTSVSGNKITFKLDRNEINRNNYNAYVTYYLRAGDTYVSIYIKVNSPL